MKKLFIKKFGACWKNCVLINEQFGFRPGRSVCTQLVEVLGKISNYIENNNCVDVIYLDFKKAFDMVPHKRLLLKIQSVGVEVNSLKWISDFFYKRTQSVRIGNFISKPFPVSSGVPQGSVLGPLLFLIFVADLPKSIKYSIIRMFADDTKIFRAISNSVDCELLQKDLDSLNNWSKTWLLNLNFDKCKVLRVGKSCEAECKYFLESGQNSQVELAHVESETDLGVVFDNKLNFKEHI